MNESDEHCGRKHVFISYSHDSDSYKEWVRKLADNLLPNGIDVQLDKYEIDPGGNVIDFMEYTDPTQQRIGISPRLSFCVTHGQTTKD